MSIQVNNIAVSIDGTQSEQFHIELYGSKFTFDSFTLTQNLLQPCLLKFTLRKDRQEAIEDVQFGACGGFIGTSITLVVQTSNTEKDIKNFQEGSQNATIEFEGFISNARAYREASEYYIQVTALSNDAKMFSHPNNYMFNDYKLADIVTEMVKSEYGLELEGKPAHDSAIHYTVQYNEGDYQFLQRMAVRYGEWMFSTGKKLHFGKLENQEEIQLKYPSQDMSEYNVRLQTSHINYGYYNMLYNHRNAVSYGLGTSQEITGSALNDSTWVSSKQVYSRVTRRVTQGAGLESDDEVTGFKEQEDENIKLHAEPLFAEQRRIRSNMVVYSGTSYCSRMKIGSKLTIKDDYISSDSSKKSEVEQDVILITGLTHTFNVNGEYENNFQGIPATIDYPPYTDQNIFPRCDHPVRAVVIDTEDPKHWGRVRVRFPWQQREYWGKHGDKEKNGISPWIHVAQPYNGANDQDGGFYGVHLIPEIFTTVLVDFEEGNYERPYVLSCFFDMEYPIDSKWYPGHNNVKAIRTASGHTIEIHDTETADDLGNSGYIRIYDNKKNDYEVLLSTEKKLISLKTTGDISLKAGGNITLQAGGGINAKAGGEINANAGSNISESAGGGISGSAGADVSFNAGSSMNLEAGSDMTASAGAKMDLAASNNMSMSAGEDLVAAASNDMHLVSDNDFYCYSTGEFNQNVGKNLTIDVTDSTNITSKNAMEFKALDIKIRADKSLAEYSMTHDVNANQSISLTATATIDIKAMMVKEN